MTTSQRIDPKIAINTAKSTAQARIAQHNPDPQTLKKSLGMDQTYSNNIENIANLLSDPNALQSNSNKVNLIKYFNSVKKIGMEKGYITQDNNGNLTLDDKSKQLLGGIGNYYDSKYQTNSFSSNISNLNNILVDSSKSYAKETFINSVVEKNRDKIGDESKYRQYLSNKIDTNPKFAELVNNAAFDDKHSPADWYKIEDKGNYSGGGFVTDVVGENGLRGRNISGGGEDSGTTVPRDGFLADPDKPETGISYVDTVDQNGQPTLTLQDQSSDNFWHDIAGPAKTAAFFGTMLAPGLGTVGAGLAEGGATYLAQGGPSGGNQLQKLGLSAAAGLGEAALTSKLEALQAQSATQPGEAAIPSLDQLGQEGFNPALGASQIVASGTGAGTAAAGTAGLTGSTLAETGAGTALPSVSTATPVAAGTGEIIKNATQTGASATDILKTAGQLGNAAANIGGQWLGSQAFQDAVKSGKSDVNTYYNKGTSDLDTAKTNALGNLDTAKTDITNYGNKALEYLQPFTGSNMKTIFNDPFWQEYTKNITQTLSGLNAARGLANSGRAQSEIARKVMADQYIPLWQQAQQAATAQASIASGMGTGTSAVDTSKANLESGIGTTKYQGALNTGTTLANLAVGQGTNAADMWKNIGSDIGTTVSNMTQPSTLETLKNLQDAGVIPNYTSKK